MLGRDGAHRELFALKSWEKGDSGGWLNFLLTALFGIGNSGGSADGGDKVHDVSGGVRPSAFFAHSCGPVNDAGGVDAALVTEVLIHAEGRVAEVGPSGTIGVVSASKAHFFKLFAGVERMEDLGSVLRPRDFSMLRNLIVTYSSYLIMFLVVVGGLVAVVRINNHPRVEVGLAALIAVAVLAALVPYSIGLHYNDYRPYSYSGWQITNWVWTIGQSLNSQPPTWVKETSIAAMLFGTLFAIATVGRRALAMRTATPEAVLAEQGKSTRHHVSNK